jgi:hypothetical protein
MAARSAGISTVSTCWLPEHAAGQLLDGPQGFARLAGERDGDQASAESFGVGGKITRQHLSGRHPARTLRDSIARMIESGCRGSLNRVTGAGLR